MSPTINIVLFVAMFNKSNSLDGVKLTIIACVTSALIWIPVRYIDLAISSQLFWRLLIASVLVKIYYNEKISLKDLLNIGSIELKFVLVKSILIYFFGVHLAAKAITITPYGSAVLALSFPAAFILAPLIFKERLVLSNSLAIILSTVGIYIVLLNSFDQRYSNVYGLLLGLIASFSISLGILLKPKESFTLSNENMIFLLFLFSSLFFLFKSLIFQTPIIPDFSLNNFINIFISGALTTTFIISVHKALLVQSILKTNLILSLKPIIASLVGYFIFREVITSQFILGSILIISSIYLEMILQKRKVQ